MSKISYSKFSHLTFADFAARAADENLNPIEKIGFPSVYREGYEEAIFSSICANLPALTKEKSVIADIGCGCSNLTRMFLAQAEQYQQTWLLADSAEMLANLPDAKNIEKIPGIFPQTLEKFAQRKGKIDAIIIYSVLHHVMLEQNPFQFLDAAVSLLAMGGRLLVGDIPNSSKRERFFSSEQGKNFHKNFMQTDQDPIITPLTLKADTIDDGILIGILQRYRNAGFEAYILPQPENLPMHNRREDLLITSW
jgi:2-polyprenyl-3-methyl-5-hydroxy-6-metoxy-1,4-benzoquinol methylase